MDKLIVRGTEVSIQWNMERDDYISLTDIAKVKDSDNPRYIIQNWMRNRNTIEFLGVWESLYNPDFNRVEFDAFRSQAGLNSFVMTPQKWIDATAAIGIISKAGRYGGTYAHKEIAFEFASLISVEFSYTWSKSLSGSRQRRCDGLAGTSSVIWPKSITASTRMRLRRT